MWTVWVIAYLMAMSPNPWYRTFHRATRPVLSLAADQQLTTGLMWLIAAVAFMPVVFWNLNQWLKSEDDPGRRALPAGSTGPRQGILRHELLSRRRRVG